MKIEAKLHIQEQKMLHTICSTSTFVFEMQIETQQVKSLFDKA